MTNIIPLATLDEARRRRILRQAHAHEVGEALIAHKRGLQMLYQDTAQRKNELDAALKEAVKDADTRLAAGELLCPKCGAFPMELYMDQAQSVERAGVRDCASCHVPPDPDEELL